MLPSPAEQGQSHVNPQISGGLSVKIKAFGPTAEQWAWLPLTTVAFIVFRWRLGTPSLWTDELATWSASTRSWSDLFGLLRHIDVAIAPYYVFMHLWVDVFGDSAVALRMPSVLAMCGVVAMTVVLGRRLVNVWVGLFAGTILLVLPYVSRLAQEARIYAFAMLCVVLTVLMLLRALEKPTWWCWLGYGALVVTSACAHLITLFMLVPHAITVAQYVAPVRDWRVWRDAQLRGWGSAAIASIVLIAPFAYVGSQQKSQVSWIAQPSWSNLDGIAARLFGSALLGGVVIGIASIGAGRLRREAGLLISWAFLSPAVLFAVSYIQPLWLARYLAFVLPAYALLAGAALASIRLRFAVVILVLLALIGWQQQKDVRTSTSHRGSGKEIAQLIRQQEQPGDGVVYSRQWAGRDSLLYYLPAKKRPRDLLATVPANERGAYTPGECADTTACIGDTRRVWVILWGHDAKKPLSRMDRGKRAVLTTNFRVARVWQLGDMTAVLFVRR